MAFRKPTMKDVAALAGVSPKTVARVVNAEPNVSDSVRRRVESAVRQLSFEKNEIASSVRRAGGRTNSIGLVVPDIANPHWARLTRAVDDCMRAEGFLVLASSSDRDSLSEEALVRGFVARRVDALILVPTVPASESTIAPLLKGLVTVYADGLPRTPSSDAVISENYEGISIAVRHLLTFGHKKIAYVGDDTSLSSARERLDGFQDAMRAAGMRSLPEWVAPGATDQASARQATSAMLSAPEPPTALVCGNNVALLGALQELHGRGLHEKVALIGFDDHAMADVVAPGITVVAQDIVALARNLRDRVLWRIDGNEDEAGRIVRVPVSLIKRGSGEIQPGSSLR